MKQTIMIILLFLSICCFSQTPIEQGLKAIHREDAVSYISVLAADSLEGRKGGRPGGQKAAEYLKNTFEEMGIKPWRGSYLQPFVKNGVSLCNVLGYIPGRLTDEIVMIGAHYDHLGIGTNRTNDSIYNGADDNASGVAGVLQVAKAFMASGQKPERTIVFGLWDGEEMGLLGSFYFVEEHFTYIPIPMLEPIQIKGYINCDMIGRNKDDDGAHVIAYYTESKPEFREWIESDIEEYKLSLSPEFPAMDNQAGGSDHMPFEFRKVPIVFYHTDLHPDYHQPSDEADKINYDKVTEIAKLSFLTLWKMANTSDW